MLLTAFVGSVWGQRIWFPQETVYLSSEDLSSEEDKTYTQQIWYEGPNPNADGWYGPQGIPGQYYDQDYDFSYEVLSGNLYNVKVFSTNEGVTTTFKGTYGSIKITAYTETYRTRFGFDFECSYILIYGRGKKWDFNTKPFTLDNPEAWNNASSFSTPADHHRKYHSFLYTLANNTVNADKTGEWLMNNDVSGFNNAYMAVHEANGLRFVTSQNNFGYNNGRDWPTTTYNNDVRNFVKNGKTDYTKDINRYTRFLCFKAGSKIIIPKTEWDGYTNPRVRIKMDREAHRTGFIDLAIYNATDAVGTPLNADNGYYDIGGCSWWGPMEGTTGEGENGKEDCLFRGEYQFQIVDKTKNFVIEIPTSSTNNNGNIWLLLYSIELYDSEELMTENGVLGKDAANTDNNKYMFLHKKYTNEQGGVVEEVKPGSAFFNLHFRGKGEPTKVAECSITGTVGTKSTNNDLNGDFFINRFTDVGNPVNRHKYDAVDGEYGTFRMRIGVYTHGGKYCTDYSYRTMSVGFMENKQYPYTWDFTDVNGFWNSSAQTLETSYNNLKNTLHGTTLETPNYKLGITNIPRNLWEDENTDKWETKPSEKKTGKGLRVSNNAGYDFLFCGGSQLWYGDKIIPETAGLAFDPVNYDATYNSAMIFGETGMTSYNDVRDWWLWRVTVPQVTSQDVIYVRAKKLVNTSYYNVGFVYGDATNKTEKKAFGTEGSVKIEKATETILGDNEVVYAIPSPSSTQNVTLFFAGVEVQKIAVSRDPKTVNKYGWATESRARVIDPELTSYMTGYDFESCPVTALDFGAKTVTLDRTIQNNNNQVMAASSTTEKDYHAYIIHHKKDAPVQILDGKFHLFVPDMHDYDGTANAQKTVYDFSDSKMTAQLSSGNVSQTEGSNTNFVLTWQYARYDKDGKLVDLNDNPVEGSTYSDYGYVGFFMVQPNGVQSNGNQGYLPIPTSQVSKANNYTLVYNDETNGIDSDVKVLPAVKDNVYYSVSGQKLDGVPTQSGIYIVNGKKVVIK